jgi:signal transduction histidine kinase
LSHQYHPSALSHSNLHAALESLCFEFENQHGIRARFRGRADTAKVARSISTAIYRIVQEALRNVARHSGAQGVVLTVECDDNELRLALLDDGKGFDRTEITKRRGLGLTSMEERALAIGGSIEFHSELGAGVRIELTAPVAEGCDEDADDGIG